MPARLVIRVLAGVDDGHPPNPQVPARTLAAIVLCAGAIERADCGDAPRQRAGKFAGGR
jgi:hypothetical protein